MIRALLIIAAVVVIVIVAVVAFTLIGFALFSMSVMFGPGFDDFGEINECAGCGGWKENACEACRWNPKYWDKMKYIGPSRWKLRKIRKGNGK